MERLLTGTRLLDRADPAVAERVHFFAAFLRNPFSVSAVTPSSPSLARAMVHDCGLDRAKVVIELGPGTGAFTRFILEQIGPQTSFLALELDAQNVRMLRRQFPGVKVRQDSAENLLRYFPQAGRHKADCIVSGLPWAGGMSDETCARVLEAVFDALRPGGVFTAMAYVHAAWFPAARRFRSRLETHFDQVDISPIVWRNLPPAFVYRCR